MPGVSYALADFVSGGPIVDLPIMEGASWSVQLNRPDELGCKIDLADDDARALDLPAATEPKKTVLLARTDDDVILAWGVIDGRTWDEDARTLELNARGVWSSYFGDTIIAPASALTASLITLDAQGYPIVNPALSVEYTGLSLGTIGKRLVQQRLAWPGAPTVFDFPPDEAGPHERTDYRFADMKRISDALSDLTQVENGPDFAFDAVRDSGGLGLRYVMRHGTEAQPRIGADAGSWALGGDSPITGFTLSDDGSSIASAAWLTAGKSAGTAIIARATNAALITESGYPPRDIVDTSHNDVTVQATLDSYADGLIRHAVAPERELSFSVRGDASPGLGAYRPGDTMQLDVPEGHPFLRAAIPFRITSVSGDETGAFVQIGCVILDA